MMQVAWITDIHLNFLDAQDIQRFCQGLADQRPDAVLVGGDIGEADTITGYLSALEDACPCPIYFVLGNHDFYGGSIAGVRAEAKACADRSSRLYWLPDACIVPLTQATCLIGHGTWADGRLGNYQASDVMLNDYFLIQELTGLDARTRLEKLHHLGDEAVAHFRRLLPQALERFRHVLVLTHVPPFRAACWHEGRISNDDYLPHFSNKAVGDVLFEAMQVYPHCRMTVLCGHTHGSGTADILPNLHVKTGGAEYGKPCLQEILAIE